MRKLVRSQITVTPHPPTLLFPTPPLSIQGLYPESNGLIDNTMYDPVFNATFSLSSPEKDNPAWYLGQPVSRDPEMLSNKQKDKLDEVWDNPGYGAFTVLTTALVKKKFWHTSLVSVVIGLSH